MRNNNARDSFQMETEPFEDDQAIYPRVGPEQLSGYIGKQVTIVGKVVGVSNQSRSVSLDIGKELTLHVEDVDIEDNIEILEVRGTLQNGQTLKADSFNTFGEAKTFDLEMFVKMLEHYHSNDYGNLTVQG